MTRSSLSSRSLHLVAGVMVGMRADTAGPAFFFFFLPTRVGAGCSYFLAFLSFLACGSEPRQRADTRGLLGDWEGGGWRGGGG